jgi:hypothetical protein
VFIDKGPPTRADAAGPEVATDKGIVRGWRWRPALAGSRSFITKSSPAGSLKRASRRCCLTIRRSGPAAGSRSSRTPARRRGRLGGIAPSPRALSDYLGVTNEQKGHAMTTTYSRHTPV